MSNGFFTSGMASTTPNYNPADLAVLTPTMRPASCRHYFLNLR